MQAKLVHFALRYLIIIVIIIIKDKLYSLIVFLSTVIIEQGQQTLP
jgi:hypothetical protein